MTHLDGRRDCRAFNFWSAHYLVCALLESKKNGQMDSKFRGNRAPRSSCKRLRHERVLGPLHRYWQERELQVL